MMKLSLAMMGRCDIIPIQKINASYTCKVQNTGLLQMLPMIAPLVHQVAREVLQRTQIRRRKVGYHRVKNTLQKVFVHTSYI
jgi:hypothetical protein